MLAEELARKIVEDGGLTLNLHKMEAQGMGVVVSKGEGSVVVTKNSLEAILSVLAVMNHKPAKWLGFWCLPDGGGVEVERVNVCITAHEALAQGCEYGQFSVYDLDRGVELLCSDGRELTNQDERRRLYEEWKTPRSSTD